MPRPRRARSGRARGRRPRRRGGRRGRRRPAPPRSRASAAPGAADPRRRLVRGPRRRGRRPRGSSRRRGGAAAGVEGGLLLRLGRQRLELGGGVGEEVPVAPRRRPPLAGLVEGAGGGGARRPGVAHGGEPGLGAGEGVEERAVAAGVHQAAVVLLAVELDEGVREGATVSAVTRRSLTQACRRPSAVAVRRRMSSSPRRRPRAGRPRRGSSVRDVGTDGEERDDLARCGARADLAAAPAPAEHEAEAVEEDRLAGPGLADQDVEARPEVELGRSIRAMSRIDSACSMSSGPPLGRQRHFPWTTWR